MPPKVKSRWPKTPPADANASHAKAPTSALKAGAKTVASKALDAAGPGISVATQATGTGAIALATGAAAASATGIGLVVVGSLATIGAAAKSIVAAKSSFDHRNALQGLYDRYRHYPCHIPPDTEGETDVMAHMRIATTVLPYAIEQKDKKFDRKAIGAVPVLGTIPMKVAQLYRAATKEDKGVLRTQMAHELAVHLITHNCGLAQAIVAELFSSYEKMLWMLDQDTDVVTPLIMDKLKSV